MTANATRWALLSALMPAILGSQAQPARPAPRADTIVAAMVEDIRGMDPRRDRDGLLGNVYMHVVEGLVGFRDDLEIGLVLARSVRTEDDGKTYVFTLRDGVKFHNGEALTAREVKWSWDYLMAPDSHWRCRLLFSGRGMKVESVEAPDPSTVIFHLDAPSGGFLYNMARPDCAQTPILHPASLNPDGSWNKPIGTGPFAMGERRVGQWAKIHRFADYARRDDAPNGSVGSKQALVEHVRFLVVTDPSARLAGLRSGDIDVASIPWQSAQDAEGDPRINVVRSDTTVWYALLLNDSDPLLKDRRLRQAIAAAIDRDAVAQAVSLGQWRASSTPMPHFSAFFSPAQARVPAADPALARRLLAEAGYAGQPVTIMANKAFDLMMNQAVIIQSMLQAVGINARIEVVDWGFQLDRYMKGSYQAQSFGYSGRFEPMGAWERIVGPETRKLWKDKEATALLARGIEARDPKVVRDIAEQLHARFLEEVPAVSLYHVGVAYGVNRRLQGVTPSPLEAVRLWNVSIKP